MSTKIGIGTNLNIDKHEIVEEIFKSLETKNKQNNPSKETIWRVVSDFEKLITSHVCTHHEFEYRLTIPTIGTFMKKKIKLRDPARLVLFAKKKRYWNTTFNEIFLSI